MADRFPERVNGYIIWSTCEYSGDRSIRCVVENLDVARTLFGASGRDCQRVQIYLGKITPGDIESWRAEAEEKSNKIKALKAAIKELEDG